MTVTLRSAQERDLPVIRRMLADHAASEAGLDVPAGRTELAEALFGQAAHVHVVVAVASGDDDDRVVGMAVWYRTFSSWAMASGIWLEDLYVDDEFRGAGVGRLLMGHLRERTTGRIEWDVTVGNTGAERFYASLGASPVPEINRYRLPAVPE
ncbi:GNAT family N-acetyltransferase [Fodinicola feengrottensis]|uniref:GNAT family N-acetyltransferase n=1 Tax=Fodinicola feengrottensis TaxID=435914 RepID=A0ABP4VDR3_9ACTN